MLVYICISIYEDITCYCNCIHMFMRINMVISADVSDLTNAKLFPQ